MLFVALALFSCRALPAVTRARTTTKAKTTASIADAAIVPPADPVLGCLPDAGAALIRSGHADIMVCPMIPLPPYKGIYLAEHELRVRLLKARAVVLGTVTSVAALRHGGPPGGREAAWKQATIAVSCALRGHVAPAVTVAFASGEEGAWRSAPKLRPGEKAVFLLQSDGHGGYLVRDPLDVQPPAPLSVRETMWCGPP